MQTSPIGPTRTPAIRPMARRIRGPPPHESSVLWRAGMLCSSSPDDVSSTHPFLAIHLIPQQKQVQTREPTHTDANKRMEA